MQDPAVLLRIHLRAGHQHLLPPRRTALPDERVLLRREACVGGVCTSG